MTRHTVIAEVALYANEDDNPSLVFCAAVLLAAKLLGISKEVRIKLFVDIAQQPYIGVSVPLVKNLTMERYAPLLKEAQVWAACMQNHPEFLLETCH